MLPKPAQGRRSRRVRAWHSFRRLTVTPPVVISSRRGEVPIAAAATIGSCR